MEQELERLEGTVEDIIYLNEDNGYTVFEVSGGGKDACDEGADLLIATTVAPEGLTCPYVSGVPFMTGMNRVAAEKAVLDVMAQ